MSGQRNLMVIFSVLAMLAAMVRFIQMHYEQAAWNFAIAFWLLLMAILTAIVDLKEK